MESVTQVLSEWVVDTKFSEVPSSVVLKAKRCLIDVIGVAIAGSKHKSVKVALKSIGSLYDKGRCALISLDGRTLSPPGAALFNGMASHVFDFDDTCYDGIVHGSAAVFPAALAANEVSKLSGKNFLLSFIVGSEVEYALGRTVTDHLYYKGWWNSGLLGCMGAAAGAAKGLRLNKRQAGHAIGIATCFTAGSKAVFGTPIKPLAMGWAAETGLKAAIFAQNDMVGPDEIFEDSRGFLKLFNDGKAKLDELKKLGKQYSLESPGTALKIYPVCSAAQAAAEATQDIMRKEQIVSRDVRKVHCEVTPLVKISLIYDRPATVAQAQFSMPFAIGSILTFNHIGLKQLTNKCLHHTDMITNMAKVSMSVSSLLSGKKEAALYPEASKVKIFTNDGRVFEQFNGAATGMPIKPMSDEQINEKFFSCASPVIGARRTSRLIDQLWDVENVPNVCRLFTC
jgi:2-methylcitrate dehydratase PrpD